MKKVINMFLFLIVIQSCNSINQTTNNQNISPSPPSLPTDNINMAPTSSSFPITEPSSYPDSNTENNKTKRLLFKGSYFNVENSSISLNDSGNGLITYINKYRLINNFSVSEKEEIINYENFDYNSASNLPYRSKLVLNNQGNGFILLFFSVTYSTDVISAFYPSYRTKSFRVENYKITNEISKSDSFDNIEINENGDGVAYTYSRPIQRIVRGQDNALRYNNITFKKIKNFVLSDKEEILEQLTDLPSEYQPENLILGGNGNGLIYNLNSTQNSKLILRKINNFNIEKNINTFEQTSISNTNDLSKLPNLDSNGNGYLALKTVDEKTIIIPIINYIINADKFFIVNSKQLSINLDSSGNGSNLYINEVSNYDKYKDTNIRYNLILENINNFNQMDSFLLEDDFKNKNILSYYIKNGNGFIIFQDNSIINEQSIYLSYIKDFKLFK